MAEEYCWAIAQTVRLSCCGRSGSCVLGFSFQLRVPLRARTIFNVYTQLRIAPKLPERNYCEGEECLLTVCGGVSGVAVH